MVVVVFRDKLGQVNYAHRLLQPGVDGRAGGLRFVHVFEAPDEGQLPLLETSAPAEKGRRR